VIELIKNAPLNYRIEPVYLSLAPIPTYYYAKSYTAKFLKQGDINTLDTPICLNKGDIFYGLDLASHEVEKATNASIYKQYKLLGVKIIFMVYDLLPILYPHFFPTHLQGEFKQWFKNISEISDQLICISEKVANDVRAQTDNKTLLIDSLHLGADISQSKEIASSDKNKQAISFLMVGTVEPRKGHQEVLEAFEELWKQGFDINLKIVGKKGWMMNDFIQALNNHPQKDKHLFYLEFVSDQILNQLYIDSDCLIAASIDEGFGLPLIEGAHHNIPLIARDIEVFREVATKYAYYFKTNELAREIKKWINLYQQEKHPLSNEMPYLTWKQNAQDLLEIFGR
jgi:glycosyltransferase involved in cell wall biosynthesis